MKTKSIRYERLKSLPGMHHIKVAKEVELEDGDDESEAMKSLQESVHKELGDATDFLTIRDQLGDLRRQRDHLQHQVDYRSSELRRLQDAIREIDGLSEKMSAAGIELPEGLFCEIPF